MALNHRKGLRTMVAGIAAVCGGGIALLASVFSGAIFWIGGAVLGVVALIALVDKRWGLTIVCGGIASLLLFGGWSGALGDTLGGILQAVGALGLIGGGIASYVGYRGWSGKKRVSGPS